MDKDNYKQTRTMSKFTVDTDDPSRWQPTPPSYLDGLEPHWNKIRPFVIETADQFKPVPPPKFSLENCETHVGDKIAGHISWRGNPDLKAWSGKPIRLRFVMTECDLYSFRFRP